ncbi:MAG: murein biosynthesis integral membrane protein MurJ, partial [Candidatus Uhrbacteria bacterium]|nr:murein biosynthesis integral membrane protein MurJ [Candidatus Uhrbacteria bacterium]
FGAGTELDAYYAAFRLPDLLFYLLIVGAFTAGFIPLFTEYAEQRGKESVIKFTAQIFTWVGIVMIALSALLIILVPWLMPLIVRGFSTQATELTITLTRIMLLSPIFLGLSAVMGGVLQATKRFFAFSLAPVLYNLGIIFGMVVLAPRMGIMGVAWGVVLGAFVHFLAQWSVARRAGFGHIVWPSFAAEGVGRLIKLTAPRLMSLAVSQINLVILLSLASSLTVGAVTVFNLANNIQSFALSIFGISFALAAFPALSQAASRRDDAAFSQALNAAGRKIVFFMLPSAALFIILRVPIVTMILHSGKFVASDVHRTADVMGWFAFSLVAQSLVPLLSRAFFALQDAWKPFWISIVCEAINLILAYWLRGPFGIVGLEIAFSVAFWINIMLLWILLHRKKINLTSADFWRSSFKTILATAALIIITPALLRQWITVTYWLPLFWQAALEVIFSSMGGGLVFLLVARWCKSEEMEEFWSGLKRRLSRIP